MEAAGYPRKSHCNLEAITGANNQRMYVMEIGVPELIIILVVLLLIFGPGRIVNVGRELGVGIRQFRQGLESPAEPDVDETPDRD